MLDFPPISEYFLMIPPAKSFQARILLPYFGNFVMSMVCPNDEVITTFTIFGFTKVGNWYVVFSGLILRYDD